ncbi:hypothetical protein [Stenotrophomonas sp. SY1]|uniref:hypothetical protein n=1 Tax=Stenotrophomonas sp. SY1 TaxID=477235 RepID=UPI001E5592AF|nr:hypothetical protein [Stenotrophomonas sp. SY1]MCD9085202.1 hypothetical protein [Stenotrophomonas sp. SY1]
MDDMEIFRIRNLVLDDVDLQLTRTDNYQVARYKMFLGIKNNIPSPMMAPYHKSFGSRDSIPGVAMAFDNALSRALVEIPNQINAFGGVIQKLEAWSVTIHGLDVEQVFMLASEHFEPLANLAISATQAIRGQIIYATVECAALIRGANGENPGWNGFDHVSMKVAKSLAGAWRGWPDLAEKLRVLEVEGLNEASGNFRNNFQHGAPRQLVVGLTKHTEWVKKDDGTFAWGIGTKQPITLREIIPHLKSAHDNLLQALESFVRLAGEWEASFPNQK